MNKNERQLQAEQLNLLNAQLGVLCQIQAGAYGHFGLKETIKKNLEIGKMLEELTGEIYE